MSRNIRSIMMFILVFVCCTVWLAACDSGNKNVKDETTQTQSADVSSSESSSRLSDNYWELLDKVSDSSELPDWTGEKLKLIYWNQNPTGNTTKFIASDPIVAREVERVTGVSIDMDNSFDSGDSPANKLAVLIASGDWPHITSSMQQDSLKKCAENNIIWDLSGLIEKFCPNIMKAADPNSVYKLTWENPSHTAGIPGKNYGIFNALDHNYLPKVRTDVDMEQWSYLYPPRDYMEWCTMMVRDDILKMIYPNALTGKEIEDIYVKNGEFTPEEIFDVPIKTKQDFIDLLYKIKDVIDKNNIMEGNKKVAVTYAKVGPDMYGTVNYNLAIMNGFGIRQLFVTYFDRTTKKVEIMPKQAWFKEDMKLLNKLFRDGILDRDSITDSQEITTARLNNGEYALCPISWGHPDYNLIKAKKPYSYRPLNSAIPFDSTRFFEWEAPPVDHPYYVFKQKVNEKQLEQILRFFDFLESEIGVKLTMWGPKTAGLWEEVNGKRRWTSKELEEETVMGENNNMVTKYDMQCLNFGGKQPFWSWPVNYGGYNTQHPLIHYDFRTRERSPGNAINYYNAGFVSGHNRQEYWQPIAVQPDWNMGESAEMTKFMKGWNGYNEIMAKVLIAKNDEEFEKYYAELIKYLDENGFDEAGTAKFNEEWFKKNEAYKDILLK